jgi:RNA polymerase sigma-70 factor (ECF subfamily)
MERRMPEQNDEFLATRQTLLEKLKQWDDKESWDDFVDTYGGLLYRTAVKAGLCDADAQDVVQETILITAKKLKEGFERRSPNDSFKGWLLYHTRNRIKMTYRTRLRLREAPPGNDGSSEIEQLADPGGNNIDAIWEAEWLRAMWEDAIAKVKKETGARQFQMFDLYVIKEVEAKEVARAFGVEVAQVYLTKHRISSLVKQELTRLKERLE